MNLIARMAIPCLLASVAWVGPAVSADYDPPLVIDAPEEVDEFVPVEVGTGWYLRGDVGYQLERQHRDGAVGTSDFLFDNNIVGLGQVGPLDFFSARVQQSPVTGNVGFGYQFNDWLRADVNLGLLSTTKASATAHLETGNYMGTTYLPTDWRNPAVPQPDFGCLGDRTITTTVQRTTTDAAGNTTTQPTQVNQQADADWRRDCMVAGSASHKAYNGMVNGYVDLGTFMGFTPYVGAGVGLIYTRNKLSLSGTCANSNETNVGSGTSFDPVTNTTTTTTTTTNVQFDCDTTTPNTTVATYDKASYDMMYGLSAGVAYKLSANTSLDLGYQYLTAPSIREYYVTNGGVQTSKGYNTHQVKIGVRYALW